jgi:hypothetical protein
MDTNDHSKINSWNLFFFFCFFSQFNLHSAFGKDWHFILNLRKYDNLFTHFKLTNFFCLQTSKRIQENFRKNQTKQFRRSPCRDAAFSGHGKESGSDFTGKTIRNSGAVSARRTSSHSRRPTRLVQLGCYSGRSSKRKCPTAFPGVDHRHHRALDGEPRSGDVRQVKQKSKTFSIL